MISRSTTIVVALTALFTVACTVEATGPVSEPEDGLILERVTDTDISGSYESANHLVAFVVTESEAGVVELTMDVDGLRIETYVDNNGGVGDVNVDNASLDVDQLAVLTELSRALTEVFEADGMTPVEDHLVRATAFMAVAPADVELAPLQVEAARGWSYIGCSCRNQYIGSGYYRTSGKGSGCTGGSGNGCKGRCGVGCGSSGHGAYTRDCAKHDYGLGSWWRASDDYLFAGSNC